MHGCNVPSRELLTYKFSNQVIGYATVKAILITMLVIMSSTPGNCKSKHYQPKTNMDDNYSRSIVGHSKHRLPETSLITITCGTCSDIISLCDLDIYQLFSVYLQTHCTSTSVITYNHITPALQCLPTVTVYQHISAHLQTHYNSTSVLAYSSAAHDSFFQLPSTNINYLNSEF